MRDAQVDGWLLPEVKLFGELAGSIFRHTFVDNPGVEDELQLQMSLLEVGS
ncbi:hypothetical protein IMZ48_32415 [Candidatus Bathyarchaeota archaeon]|nr:hypothetical protein [Candidatus Bathyarchaeota archaeon]